MRISKFTISEIDAIEDFAYKVFMAAKMYASAGFYVIPIQPNGKAIPNKRYGISYPHASKRRKVVEKWFGEGGKFEGWNIGLATGRQEGIFVVDLDVKGDKDGIKDFEKLMPEGWEYEGPVQTTPSGGTHLVFQWREHARSTTESLSPAIDTRGGTDDQCRGHIVAWPSTIEGERYYWASEGEVRPTPDWIIAKLGTPFNSTNRSGRGNENLADGDFEDKFSIDRLQTMLEIIDPNDLSYDEWLKIGQAIHTQHADDAGFYLWDAWSQAGDRYEANECIKRWQGFNNSGAVRVGTIIHYATQRGYDLKGIADQRLEYDDKIEAIVEQMNRVYAVCPMGSDIMIVERCEVVPEMAALQAPYRFWKKVGFRNYFENQITTAVDNEGKIKKLSYADIWLGHPERSTYPSGVGLFPSKPERYRGYFNLWQGFAIEPSPGGSWSHFKWHIHYILCGGDDMLNNWVLDWMADLIQDPGNPKGCAIVMHGVEGCGKGTFSQMIGKLFGTHYKHLTDQEHLVGRFNGHMADAIFVFADEAVFGGDRKIAGKLKSLVTEPIITSERKGVDAIQFRNCAHLTIASNESWFIPAGPQSRRWLVLDVRGDKANDTKYFRAIHQEMEKDGGLEAMMYELQHREVTSNLRQAPETQALQMQREQYTTMDSAIEWWVNQLTVGVMAVESAEASVDPNGKSNTWPERVLKNDMFEAYNRWCNENKRRKVAPSRFYSTMISAGLEPCRLKIGGGNRPYGYRVPEHHVCEDTAKSQFGYMPQRIEDDEG